MYILKILALQLQFFLFFWTFTLFSFSLSMMMMRNESQMIREKNKTKIRSHFIMGRWIEDSDEFVSLSICGVEQFYDMFKTGCNFVVVL